MMQGATLRRRSVDASDVEEDVGSAHHSAPLRGRQGLAVTVSRGWSATEPRAVATKWSRRLYNTSHFTHHNMSSGYGLTGGMCDSFGQDQQDNWDATC
jgi:hypothetical protein